MGITIIECVIIVFINTGDLIGNLAAYRFRIVSTVPVDGTRLVGSLEILKHSSTDILPAWYLIGILQSP